MNNKELKVTHGISNEFYGKNDGIKRKTNLFKTDDVSFLFQFITYWDGEEKDPLITSFSIGKESFESLSTLIIEFNFNLDDWKVDLSVDDEI